MIPKKVFFTRGRGTDKTELQSFEQALRDAGIAKCNLVKVSSILPPNCEEISREEGLKLIKAGQILFVVIARNASNELKKEISASIGVAKPRDNNCYGYLSEHHSMDQSARESGEYAEELAATMLASSLGIEFDAEAAYDKKKEIFHLSNKIVETKSISISAMVEDEKMFTTVVAAAVFIMD